MTKIDIFSGFLGAGKTTLIKKLIGEAFTGEKLVLIENEFGEIGIDGGFLKESGINITEMNSGCICCSLVGDFATALSEVIEKYNPNRILIEPSGVGKLSDVIKAVEGIDSENIKLNSAVAVADAKKCKMYMKNFGEFYNNQLEHAGAIILSRTDGLNDAALEQVLELIRDKNKEASVITTPWDKITGEQILAAIEKTNTIHSELERLHNGDICPKCGHHHGHHHEEQCDHDHHKHHERHEHHHDEHCEHIHEHDHEHHGYHCDCGCHHHHEHGHDHPHHADEVFDSIGFETANKYTPDEINNILAELDNIEKYGNILRAKGYFANAVGEDWWHFDFVPAEKNLRFGSADVIGRVCVIGTNINRNALKELFRAQ